MSKNALNERKGVRMTVKCDGCGREFVSQNGVTAHKRHCPALKAAQQPEPAAAAAPVVSIAQPERASAPVAAAVQVAAAVAAAPLPPAPPAQSADQVTWLPRMPLPDATVTGPAVELVAGQPAQPAAAPVAPPQPVGIAEPPPAPPQQPGQPEAAASPVDVVRLLQVVSRRVFTWPGSGAIDDEEAALLRQVMTWRPGEATGAALVLSGIFLPRLLSHPLVGAFVTKHLQSAMGLSEPEPTPEAPAQPEPGKAAAAATVIEAEFEQAPAQPAPPAKTAKELEDEAWARVAA
jgi:hypothetical protein